MQFEKMSYIPTAVIALGVAMLVSSGVRAYSLSSALEGSDLGAWLKFLQIAAQSVTAAALIFYFSIGNLKPVKFQKAETPGWDASHCRPSFTSYARNPVLSKFGRIIARPPRS